MEHDGNRAAQVIWPVGAGEVAGIQGQVRREEQSQVMRWVGDLNLTKRQKPL